MRNLYIFKNTLLIWVLILTGCGNSTKTSKTAKLTLIKKQAVAQELPILIAANNTTKYLPLLKNKKVAVVANPTSVIYTENGNYVHLVDSLLSSAISIEKVFAPEHGFRGTADAGESVADGKDTKTGLPIISLYGSNKKPSQTQLNNIDIVLFDIQDVGVRFYTYIATMQLVMEACAEKGIPIIVLDRPNPNAHYVDGPTMEKAHRGFLGKTTIPLVYGMTMAEYALMINNEGWLDTGKKVDLTVIPLENYTHTTPYILPIKPSPNLPNAQSVALYPSLGLLEGTTLNAGRGTTHQFQQIGAPFLDSTLYKFQYSPKSMPGAKKPKHLGKVCYGLDLSKEPIPNKVDLQWLVTAYQNSTDKNSFFLTASFTKHAGTTHLQKQIEKGISAKEIRKTWQKDLAAFKIIREKYLLYK